MWRTWFQPCKCVVTRPWQIPELEWAFASAAGGVINTTDVVLAAAAGAGLRRYICSMQLSNNSAVATEIVLKDGAPSSGEAICQPMLRWLRSS